MRQADETITLHQWKKISTVPIFNPHSELPTSITTLAKYFHKVYLPKKGETTTVYPMIFIGHNVDFG